MKVSICFDQISRLDLEGFKRPNGAPPSLHVAGTLLTKKREQPASLLVNDILKFQRKTGGSYCAILSEDDGRRCLFTDALAGFTVYWSVSDNQLLVSDKLSDFRQPWNDQWVENYFKGIDATQPATCLQNVFRLQAGELLYIDQQGVKIEKAEDIVSRWTDCFSNPIGDIEQVSKMCEIHLLESLNLIYQQHGRIGIKLSQGVDSLYLLALLKKSQIPFVSVTRMYCEDQQSEAWKMLEEHLRVFPHENIIDVVPDTVLFDPEVYHQPDCHMWHGLAITKPTTVRSAQSASVKCLLSANIGDDVFLHRMRYLTAHALAYDPRFSSSPPEPQVLLNDVEKAFPELLSSYCYNPKEISKHFVHYFWEKGQCQFLKYLFENLHVIRGISFEHDLTRTTGLEVIDLLRDIRLFEIALGLNSQDRPYSMMHAEIQRKTISKILGDVPIAKKSSNFTPSDREFYLDPDQWRDLENAMKHLESFQLSSIDYYKGLYDRFLTDHKIGKELSRVLSFYYFSENRT